MLLWTLLSYTHQTSAQNLLADGSFNATSSITPYYTGPEPQNIWCSWLNNGTNVATEVNAGVCKYTIQQAGSQTWDVQLIQWGFLLEAGYAYQLQFDVKADADRSFGVYIGEQGGSWINLNKSYAQTAGTNWQSKTINFNASSVAPLQKLSFEMGGSAVNMYFDNIVLVKTGPMPPPSIDIIGSAVPPYDWSVGVDMQTMDGKNYFLSNYSIKAGAVKFRQDQDWATNWGGNSFPVGTAIKYGPDIAVMAGTYDINFNRETGEYSFTCPSCPPAIGIIGSSVPPYNWMEDVKMTTADGINYSLKDYELANGELKFRQNSDWAINWGGTDFPIGIATLNGPNIPVVPGRYDIQFNRMTGAYSFIKNMPSVGILGSALNGWDVDIDMETMDGVFYVLRRQAFNNGEVKFRQDNSWNINWGGSTFPWGTAYPNGPNIVVPEGIYDVYFNRLYGNYYFQVICPDPVLNCPADTTIAAEPGKCGAVVYFKMPTPADNCGQPMVYQTGGFPSGSFFPVGKWTQRFVLVNNVGRTAFCSFDITVADLEPPTIADISTSATTLWPPNHKMVDVKLFYNTWDNCGPVNTSIAVTSNEPVNGLGDGDTAPDWIVVDSHLVRLRAERSGTGKGRTYSISVRVTDLAGNSTTKTVTVYVPHDASVISKKDSEVMNTGGDGYSNLKATITPNPSAQAFTLYLQSASAEKAVIRILDMNGRTVATLQTNGNNSIRFGNELKPGVYLVEITQGKQRLFSKIIKQ